MSEYTPKVGDRVRVVIEGEVADLDSIGGFEIHGRRPTGAMWMNAFHPQASHVVSVEKVAPPLPTTPGSVIISTNGEFLAHLSLSGRWVTDGGSHIEPEPGYWKPFDAGQVTP